MCSQNGTHSYERDSLYVLPNGFLSLAVLKFEKFQIEFNNIHSWPNYQILDSYFYLLNISTYMPYHLIISSYYIIQTHFQSQPTTFALVRPSICILSTLTKSSVPVKHLDVSGHISNPLSSIPPSQVLSVFIPSHSPVSICVYFSDNNSGLSLALAFNLYFQTHSMVNVPCLKFDFPRSICHFILFVCLFNFLIEG